MVRVLSSFASKKSLSRSATVADLTKQKNVLFINFGNNETGFVINLFFIRNVRVEKTVRKKFSFTL